METTWKTQNGRPVGYSKKHMRQHRQAVPLLQKAISQVSLDDGLGQFFKVTVDMGRIVGACECVSVTPDDKIVYKTRAGRKWPTKFVLNRAPDPSSLVTMIGFNNRDQVWILSAWIGGPAEREVADWSIQHDPVEKAKSEAFWANRALCMFG